MPLGRAGPNCSFVESLASSSTIVRPETQGRENFCTRVELSKPSANRAVRFQRRQFSGSLAALTMGNDGGVFSQISHEVRFDFVLFMFGIISRHLSAVVAPRFFDHPLFPEEIGAFQCAFFRSHVKRVSFLDGIVFAQVS